MKPVVKKYLMARKKARESVLFVIVFISFFGFLTADVNSNRIVDRPDQQQLQADRGQPITAANFRDDINLSGIIDRPDLQSVQTNRGHSIP